MDSSKHCVTPFIKQCFVTAGVSLTVASTSIVAGYSACLLDQLKEPGSILPVDDVAMSWIVSLPAFSMFLGNAIAVPIMGKYGMKPASLSNLTLLFIGWICIIFSTNITLFQTMRFLHGISIGISLSYGSLLIGEYTSPHYRGSFLMMISITMATATLLVHALGFYLSWQTVAMISAVITLLNLLMVLASPESPSWLALQGRHEECKKIFRWLRGPDEEDELRKIIEASIIITKTKAETKIRETFYRKLHKRIAFMNKAVRKKEFYKPVIIVIHLYIISSICGIQIISCYAPDWFRQLTNHYDNMPLIIITMDIQRIISNVFSVFIIKKFKRRTFMLISVGFNILAMAAIGVYSYIKELNLLPFDHPMIGILLTHCLIFSIAIGSFSLAFIISGEIFALEYKNISTGICIFIYSLGSFFVLKSYPYCMKWIGVYGTCLMNAAFLSYCLLIAWIMLPETKGRMLQDIEDEIRGRPLSPTELKSVQSLTVWKPNDSDD